MRASAFGAFGRRPSDHSALRQETSPGVLANLGWMSISLHPDAPEGQALAGASPATDPHAETKPSGTKIRSRLFIKYVALFVAVVGAALLSNGIFEVFFYYREHKAALIRIQHEQAEAAAAKIGQFIKEIESQLGWTTQLPWSAGSIEQRRFDALRLLRQVPAITELAQVDSTGKERLRVSRLAMDVVDSGLDLSHDPKFTEAVAHKVYYGPVYFRRESEPYMTLSLAGTRKDAGVSIAEVNLKLIWDVVSQIKVGEHGHAYVVDAQGRLIAHPDISLVLRNTDMSGLMQVQAARVGNAGTNLEALEDTENIQGQKVLTASAPIAPLGWTMFVELPVEEAYASLHAALKRLAVVLTAASLFAVLAGIFLARRMVGPIQALRAGAARIGGGDFGQRISIKTGDELEALADQFNDMGSRLHESYTDLENKVELRTIELSETLQQQTATADVLRAISRSVFDLDTVLDTLISTAARLCGADQSQIFRRDGDVYRYAASKMTVSPAYLQHEQTVEIRAGRGTLIGRVALAKRAISIADAWNDPEYEEKELARVGNVRAMLGVPLMRDGEPIGAFALARSEPVPFTQRQIELVQTFADQAVIAIENARLFEETKDALERQTATADILKVIANSPSDVRPVFEAIVTNAKQLLGAFSAGVFRLIDGFVHLEAFTPTDPAADEALRNTFPMPASDYLQLELVQRGESIQFPDTEKAPEVQVRIARTRGFRSVLLTPLMQQEIAIGLVVVTRTTTGPFTDHSVRLLRTFADQAVIAIENTRLFNETKEALERQTATAGILKVIASSPSDVQPVFEAIARSANTLIGGFSSTVFRFIDGIGHLKAFTPTTPAADEVLRSTFPLPITDFAPFQMAQAGEATQIADTETLSNEILAISRARGFRSILFAPMMSDGVAIGSIAVTRVQPGVFADHHVQLLQTFADQAVIAIENVRLFDEVQAKTSDLSESLQQQTATADVLKVISRSAFDLKSVLTTLIESAKSLCGASLGIICLRDGEVMRLQAESGCTQAFLDFMHANPIRPGRETLTGRVSLDGKPVHVADVQQDPEYNFGQAPTVGAYRAVLAVPLMRDSAVEGVLLLGRPEPGPFNQRQIDLVQTFADQAVIAIENVRLFEQVQARTGELSSSLDELRTAQDRLVQTEKLASLGQLTAGIAHEIKNPLNFVNNFSALSAELIDELNDALKPVALDGKVREEIDELTQMLKGNLEKVVQHGKRADSIVKNMLLHSREGAGEHRPADINAIVEESLNLAYHGARAERAGFNITLQRDLDPAAGMIDLYPQEMTRVFLNLISNGFYAAAKRKEAGEESFEPTLSATTKSLGNKVEIRIRDNGTGIPPEVREKMFNPFFTTKPAGEGTGLGLSMSHDIVVKQHGGKIEVDTTPGAFTEFIITLPRTGAARSQAGGEN
jgi:two-component system NtrC family sensor kinase